MIFLLMFSLAFFPLAAGGTIIYILGKTKLSKLLFIFFLFISIWQMDVSLLYVHEFLPITDIEFLFRLLRFGSIMLGPTLFHVIYVAIHQSSHQKDSKILKYMINKHTVLLFYLWTIFVYIIGWSHHGIDHLEFVQLKSFINVSFLFPVYGTWAWIFNYNLFLLMYIIIFSLIICTKIKDSEARTFLIYFIIVTAFGYFIGVLNMFKNLMLLPSSIAVLYLSIGILIPVIRMHKKIISNMNSALIDQKEFLRKIIDFNPSYIYAKNQDGKYTLTNRAYGMLFGVNSEELIGKDELEVNPDINIARKNIKEDKEVLSSLKEKHIPEEELMDQNGIKRWIQKVKLPIVSSDEKQILCVATDITQRKIHEKKIEWQAFHDTLTGLPNRRAFHQALIQQMEEAKRNQQSVAVIFLDLDRFKIINDTLNHENGDLLLIKVAERLLKTIALTDYTVYRLGGDEFTFILSNVTKEETTIFVEKLIHIFKKSFVLKQHELFVTSSIGISMYPMDGDSPEILIKNADIAMYSSKDNGKNAYTFYSSEMKEAYHKKMILEKALRKALDLHEFHIEYQPKMNIISNSIIGMEALIRWNSSELGRISPAEFIPLAEETGLILPLGEWILKTACTQNKHWQDKGLTCIPVSVNISTRQFTQGNFVDTIVTILKETKLDPKYLELEITESIAMVNIDCVITRLIELKNIGISISIDDFGTGYSSLNYLKKFPIDTLKIDKSFIRDITRNEENRSIVKTIISMADNLNLDVIAEGVEEEEELNFLKENGCKKVQGYYFSQPIPSEQFEKCFLQESVK